MASAAATKEFDPVARLDTTTRKRGRLFSSRITLTRPAGLPIRAQSHVRRSWFSCVSLRFSGGVCFPRISLFPPPSAINLKTAILPPSSAPLVFLLFFDSWSLRFSCIDSIVFLECAFNCVEALPPSLNLHALVIQHRTDSTLFTHHIMVGQGPLSQGRYLPSDLNTDMQASDEKRRPAALNLTPARCGSSGSSSSDNSLKPPRTPRFAEATSVHSPVDGRSPFADPEKSHVPQAQPGDIGFGYIGNNRESVAVPMTPRSPLKSALRVPGTPGRHLNNPLSPTFREEDILEKRELATEKEQARDVVCKSWFRHTVSPANHLAEN